MYTYFAGSSDLYLKVEGIKGQWACYTNQVLIPNVPVGPDLPGEESRVASELNKILWDYRTKREGIIVPEGRKSSQGFFHDFPWEPTIPASEATFFTEAREASKPADDVEVVPTRQVQEDEEEGKGGVMQESMFEGYGGEPETRVSFLPKYTMILPQHIYRL
jgi:hypothetical protein